MAKGNPGPKNTKTTVIPALRYHDAAAAVEWLCRAFGFTKHLVVPDGKGGVEHAELAFGNGMIVLGPLRHSEFDKLLKTSRQLGGANIQTAYLVVRDADAHYARATAAKAKVVYDIRDEDYGGRGYSCLDPEGNLWNFGTYDPWNPPKIKQASPAKKKPGAKAKPARKAKASVKPKPKASSAGRRR